MPRTRSLAWAELKIGLISTFAIVMTVLMIFLLSGDMFVTSSRTGVELSASDPASNRAIPNPSMI